MNRLLLVSLLVVVPLTRAQRPSAPGGSPAGTLPAGNAGLSTTNANGSTRGTLNTPTSNDTGGFDQSHPVFLSGTVMFDDGSSTNSDIRIERVCNGNPHLEAHTDSKGRFSFQVGAGASTTMSDASSSDSFGPTLSNQNPLDRANRTGPGGTNGLNTASLMGCELRASYPGYLSDSVDLSQRRSLDDPKVGTIILHHLGNVKGTTISVTTSLAPKSAQKSFEKGNALVQKGKFEEAEEKFASATTEYPKFAAAWFALGQVQQRLNQMDEAQKSYLAAAKADEHYVSPYDQLALLAVQQGKWQDAAAFSKQATDLNPVEFPSSFWYSALANYNLKNNAEAEKSARALLKLDSRHKYPQVEQMLAEFAANRGDLDDAAAHLKAYLALVPTAKNADTLRVQLARIEQARATQAKNAPAVVSHP